MTLPRVVLRGGPPVHPHVYSKRVYRVDRGVEDGDVVDVRTREGRPCGYGFYHGRSLVAVRVLSHDPKVVPDESWFRSRIRASESIRRDLLRLPERTDAWRIVHGEGDGLSGLVVDRYGDAGTAALFSLGWARRLDEVRRVLAEEAGLSTTVAKVDTRTATQEGIVLDPPPKLAPVSIEEDGVRFSVDLVSGHKTGFFLDQRENRRRLAALARGRVVFDGMTYTGGFALAAAKAGAASVTGMDLDEAAVTQARRNARLNDLEGERVTFTHGDVFHALRAYAAAPARERPEVVVVDPPKWARDRAGLGSALARYRDLNRLALEALRPGGVLLTNSCSGLVQPRTFLEVVRDAALDLKSEVRILARTGAAPDHPVNPVFPEGRYLKSVFLTSGGAGTGPGQTKKE